MLLLLSQLSFAFSLMCATVVGLIAANHFWTQPLALLLLFRNHTICSSQICLEVMVDAQMCFTYKSLPNPFPTTYVNLISLRSYVHACWTAVIASRTSPSVSNLKKCLIPLPSASYPKFTTQLVSSVIGAPLRPSSASSLPSAAEFLYLVLTRATVQLLPQTAHSWKTQGCEPPSR